jgi:hypothetical protein
MKTFVPLRFRRPLLVWTLILSFLTSFAGQQAAPAPALTDAEKALSASVKTKTIQDLTAALSAPGMEGRGTAQAGGDKAAQFIADYFAQLKLKPAGEKNAFFQSIEFKEQRFTAETSLKIGDEALQLGKDFAPAYPLTGDEDAKGEMVFVAYALKSQRPNRDDLNGVDVRGKIVVMMYGPPKAVTKKDWKKADVQIDLIFNLVRGGAKGLIFIDNGLDEQTGAEGADYYSRRQIERPSGRELPAELPPFIQMSEQAAEKLFAKTGRTYQQALDEAEKEGFKPYSLKQNAAIKVRYKTAKGKSSNVAAVLEGSDAKLKEEAIVYSAHYDAYGKANDGRIYPGAADNALGVAEMLAVAEALANAPVKPRRSVIFLAVTGEEYGLLGSEYWAENPTWNIKRVAANLNLDGVGTEVYGPVKAFVGYGAEHSELGALLNDVAAAQGVRVTPDPIPDENIFRRSDHYAFVKKGVPALMLLGAPDGPTEDWIKRMKAWEKTDYHQPTDTIKPDWDWSGPLTVAQTFAIMGWRVGNADKMPAWLSKSIYNRERGTNEKPPEEP